MDSPTSGLAIAPIEYELDSEAMIAECEVGVEDDSVGEVFVTGSSGGSTKPANKVKKVKSSTGEHVGLVADVRTSLTCNDRSVEINCAGQADNGGTLPTSGLDSPAVSINQRLQDDTDAAVIDRLVMAESNDGCTGLEAAVVTENATKEPVCSAEEDACLPVVEADAIVAEGKSEQKFVVEDLDRQVNEYGRLSAGCSRAGIAEDALATGSEDSEFCQAFENSTEASLMFGNSPKLVRAGATLELSQKDNRIIREVECRGNKSAGSIRSGATPPLKCAKKNRGETDFQVVDRPVTLSSSEQVCESKLPLQVALCSTLLSVKDNAQGQPPCVEAYSAAIDEQGSDSNMEANVDKGLLDAEEDAGEDIAEAMLDAGDENAGCCAGEPVSTMENDGESAGSNDLELMVDEDESDFVVSLHGSLSDVDQLREEHAADLEQMENCGSVADANAEKKERADAQTLSDGNGRENAKTSVCIRGLHPRMRAKELTACCEQYGTVATAQIVNKRALRKRGGGVLGFVSMSTVDEAKRLIQGLHKKYFRGRLLMVDQKESGSNYTCPKAGSKKAAAKNGTRVVTVSESGHVGIKIVTKPRGSSEDRLRRERQSLETARRLREEQRRETLEQSRERRQRERRQREEQQHRRHEQEVRSMYRGRGRFRGRAERVGEVRQREERPRENKRELREDGRGHSASGDKGRRYSLSEHKRASAQPTRQLRRNRSCSPQQLRSALRHPTSPAQEGSSSQEQQHRYSDQSKSKQITSKEKEVRKSVSEILMKELVELVKGSAPREDSKPLMAALLTSLDGVKGDDVDAGSGTNLGNGKEKSETSHRERRSLDRNKQSRSSITCLERNSRDPQNNRRTRETTGHPLQRSPPRSRHVLNSKEPRPRKRKDRVDSLEPEPIGRSRQVVDDWPSFHASGPSSAAIACDIRARRLSADANHVSGERRPSEHTYDHHPEEHRRQARDNYFARPGRPFLEEHQLPLQVDDRYPGESQPPARLKDRFPQEYQPAPRCEDQFAQQHELQRRRDSEFPQDYQSRGQHEGHFRAERPPMQHDCFPEERQPPVRHEDRFLEERRPSLQHDDHFREEHRPPLRHEDRFPEEHQISLRFENRFREDLRPSPRPGNRYPEECRPPSQHEDSFREGWQLRHEDRFREDLRPPPRIEGRFLQEHRSLPQPKDQFPEEHQLSPHRVEGQSRFLKERGPPLQINGQLPEVRPFIRAEHLIHEERRPHSQAPDHFAEERQKEPELARNHGHMWTAHPTDRRPHDVHSHSAVLPPSVRHALVQHAAESKDYGHYAQVSGRAVQSVQHAIESRDYGHSAQANSVRQADYGSVQKTMLERNPLHLREPTFDRSPRPVFTTELTSRDKPCSHVREVPLHQSRADRAPPLSNPSQHTYSANQLDFHRRQPSITERMSMSGRSSLVSSFKRAEPLHSGGLFRRY